LREIHHNYASLNIQELTRDLKKEYNIADYSELVPLELYFLKERADRLDAIKEVSESC
jgi:NurA-like 5'-3' nuclease